ncbi:MAG: fatty acid desaturase family protein [Methylobacter sp.]
MAKDAFTLLTILACFTASGKLFFRLFLGAQLVFCLGFLLGDEKIAAGLCEISNIEERFFMNQAQLNDETGDAPHQDKDIPNHSAGIRIGPELLKATAPFAVESVARSWWYVGSTFVMLIAALLGSGMASWPPLRMILSILGALLMVRAFITYHDFMHGTILRDSLLARLLFEVYGAFALTPPRSWKKSHNYHHGHVGQIAGSGIGSFPVMTTRMWREASSAERFKYRVQRHPLTIICAYVTIFGFSICLQPLLVAPAKHWDSALSLCAHFGLIALLWQFGSFDTAFFVVLLPMAISSALGGYLFFAQHVYKRMTILSPESWTYHKAALESSSYMQLNKVMQWFTGNIGYHHIHHLNVHIPFYRLPEAMAAIPELQSPATTSLALREIVECFRANLWDEDKQQMVTYHEAEA